MEIRDLTYFRAVINAGGVTAAAELLHMSPGALSRALHRFEDDIGHRLLKRSGRKLVMTEIGQRLFERSARLLDEHKALLSDLDGQSNAVLDIAFKVGFNSNSAFYTAFRKYVGKTPAQFRRLQTRKAH